MRKNILVTGSHRSGSTWVGKVLAKSEHSYYIHEPFNLGNKSSYKTPLNYWFEYIGNDSVKQQAFVDYIHYYCNGNFHSLYDRMKRNSIRSYPYILKSETLKILNRNKRKIFKDPIAFFSADFFYNYFDSDVAILIRHPAAFAESLKSKDWKHDFTHFIQQPDLMENKLLPFKSDIQAFLTDNEKQKDIIEHAILLWNIFHHQILEYQKNYNSWHFIKHETLSINPQEEFKILFKKLNIEFDSTVEKFITETTSSDSVDGEYRNALTNVKKWKTRLTSHEIERIYFGTEKISKLFYSKEEW